MPFPPAMAHAPWRSAAGRPIGTALEGSRGKRKGSVQAGRVHVNGTCHVCIVTQRQQFELHNAGHGPWRPADPGGCTTVQQLQGPALLVLSCKHA